MWTHYNFWTLNSYFDFYNLPPAIFSAKSVTIWVKLMGPGASPTRLLASASVMGRPMLTKAAFKSLAVMMPSLSTSMIPKASLNSWICFWLKREKMLDPDFLAFFDPFPGWNRENSFSPIFYIFILNTKNAIQSKLQDISPIRMCSVQFLVWYLFVFPVWSGWILLWDMFKFKECFWEKIRCRIIWKWNSFNLLLSYFFIA